MGKEGLILIVEDDWSNRLILKNLFADIYDILEAENGKEAIELIHKNEDELSAVILDLYMPIMDGYEVLTRLSNHTKWRDIPVIITTADESEETNQRLVNLGACYVMHKPIQVGIVRQQIINIVDRYKKYEHFMREYMLQKTLINQTAHTFLCIYHFQSKKLDIAENYMDFVPEDFVQIFDTYPFVVKRYMIARDPQKLEQFFDVEHKKRMYDEIEVRIRVDQIHYEWFKMSMILAYDEHHVLDKITLFFANIEQEVEVKEKLTFMAVNDMLTHIPNMQTFADDVREMINKYPEENFLMLTMDIYQFHLINKLFGYSEGNNVLKYFATKLQEVIESYPHGVYCRMASDIFYACIPDTEDLTEFIEILRDCMHSYPIKFDLKLCFGIYQIEDRQEEVESMIEHSAYARAEGKKNPLCNIQYYDEKLKEKDFLETFITAEMESALKKGQFEVFYQPKCNSRTDKIIGSEALIRWNHPERGYLSPGIFIPIFEQNGFITELDCYVYKSVCKTLRDWIDRGITPFPVSVNVSRCDLYDSKLAERIFEIVERYNVPKHLIEFEITESAFVLDGRNMLDFSQKMRDNGFKVLIDDFGSGYSSLNSLKEIMVDVLKIDIKFLPVSQSDEKSPIILASVIDMAKKLGLDVIAEGVENKEQLKLLDSLGCKKIQGFYYYRPLPLAQYEESVRTQENN